MAAVTIRPFLPVQPRIYCYTTPGVSYHEGWVKIGYTEKQSVQGRIAQQTHTAGVRTILEWQELAQFKDGSFEWFTDRDFHKYLTVDRQVEREQNTEWFHVAAKAARDYFNDYADRRSVYETAEHYDYQLRQEQQDAVEKTASYFAKGGTEFLWNAKPRFGKTLTAYDLIRRLGYQRVLIVSNRPSIANSWAEDFNKFIGWRGGLAFISETDSLQGKQGVMTRVEYLNSATAGGCGFIEFESLQNLKGSRYFGGEYEKLEWLAATYTASYRNDRGKPVYEERHGLTFDLLIVDESHEGVDTMRTERAFRNIKREHTLYLSGTPFRVLAGERRTEVIGDLGEEQIYNWTYADEQQAKQAWNKDGYNPYEPLPRLAMYTYQLSNMIYDQLSQGAAISDEGSVDYAFDLNEFFATNNAGRFCHEEEVKKFLHTLSTNEKYPFSTQELRAALSHTMWRLDRVDSCKALARLLHEDPVFSQYEVIVAAGDGRLEEDSDTAIGRAYDRVKEAIAQHDKTITLTVGQLTVGVTIPEWSGVLMLCNMKSPADYMQSAFRAQNQCMYTRLAPDGRPETVRKDTAYLFDFDPTRTLTIYDQFATNLSPETAGNQGTNEDRLEKIRTLLNFFPVIGEDKEGRMVELDAQAVLSIPRRLKCTEVVRRGFMSNFLFRNIERVFSAPSVVKEIISKLTPAQEEPRSKDRRDGLENMEAVPVNKDGQVDIPTEVIIGKAQGVFGPKVYEELGTEAAISIEQLQNSPVNAMEQGARQHVEKLKEVLRDKVIAPVVNQSKLPKAAKQRLQQDVEREVEQSFTPVIADYVQKQQFAVSELEQKRKEAETPGAYPMVEQAVQKLMEESATYFINSVKDLTNKIIQDMPTEIVRKREQQEAEAEKKKVEDTVRDHLRGFSRTIPSFLMAYGDKNLTLANLDDYTEDDVFLEVTGITEEDFRFLRDGGTYEENGETKHFEGHLFDETVFNDSVQEFLRKKEELANYFDEGHKEDIFDYIPPQRTNQIFTPRWVVKKMVDALEAENPGCFDNPATTFADLYMKSGLYVTEIVKRLFHSQGLEAAYPDEGERIRHILSQQVYGMAPTRIIYLIATNYILGFDATLKNETKNFVQADAAEAAKAGTLARLVEEKFG